ncbi:MAG: GNAT family N-acetyltransferase [Polyangiaceae bacterium]|nr:GNAT family N-acetyltransferase [Polyangiaceae bacterium]
MVAKMPWGEVRTPLCTLRDFRDTDAPALAGYRSDPEVALFQGWTPPFTEERALALIHSVRSLPFGTADSWFQVALADPLEDHLLGDIGLHFLADGFQVEIGFTLARANWGKGIAAAGLRALLDKVFVYLGKHRAIAVIDARNTAAEKLLTGVRFRQEAHFVQGAFFKGQWVDEKVFACLSHEWQIEREAAG